MNDIQKNRISELMPAIAKVRAAAASECDEITNLVRIGRTGETYQIAVVGMDRGDKVVLSAHLPKSTANRATQFRVDYDLEDDFRAAPDHLVDLGFVEVN